MARQSKTTRIRLKWGEGEHDFDLTPRPGDWGVRSADLHDREHAILQRLLNGGWGRQDVENTVLVALVNAMPAVRIGSTGFGQPHPAHDLVARHITARPLAESVPVAQTVLMAVIYGVTPALSTAAVTPESFITALAKAA